MMRLHGKPGSSIVGCRQTGRDLWRNTECRRCRRKEDNDDRLGTVAVSYTYVKNQICNQLGEEYLEQSPLEQGRQPAISGEQHKE